MMKALVVSFAILGGLACGGEGLCETPPLVSDLHAIDLQDGINSVPQMTPDGRAGVIVRVAHSSSPIADGNSVNYLVMLPAGTGGGWVAADAQETPSQISDTPFGGILLSAAPHDGEDWKRSIAFAHAKVSGRPSLLMVVAERDLRRSTNAYAPAPAEVTVFRLTADPEFGDAYHFAPISRRRTIRCYVDVQLAVSEVEGLPLPPNYAGPKASAACPSTKP
jgi:hypothetical protein